MRLGQGGAAGAIPRQKKVVSWAKASYRPDMSEPILRLEGVSKWYPGASERRVLDQLDLSVEAGERFAIVGPSGCGKSTLLNLLGTLDQPSEGRVIVDGIDTAGLDEEALARIRSEKIGFIFQMHHLLPQCTALENVLVPTLALAHRPAPAAATERARQLFDRVGLADKLERLPSQLSGGERQRVAVVRALINSPRLLLADEPTGALDEDNARRLMQLLVELNESEGLALIVVTHDRALAGTLGSVRVLQRGQLREQD